MADRWPRRRSPCAGSIDSPGSGISGYQYRAVDRRRHQLGLTRRPARRRRSPPRARRSSSSGRSTPPAWCPTGCPPRRPPGSTVRLDRTLPTAPAVSGGSSSAGRTSPQMTIARRRLERRRRLRPQPLRVPHLDQQRRRAGAAASTGSSVTVTPEGIDAGAAAQRRPGRQRLGLGAGHGGRREHRRRSTAPRRSAPTTLTGGSLSWQTVASVSVTAAGATDTSGSGVTGYQYRTLDRRRDDLGLALVRQPGRDHRRGRDAAPVPRGGRGGQHLRPGIRRAASPAAPSASTARCPPRRPSPAAR